MRDEEKLVLARFAARLLAHHPVPGIDEDEDILRLRGLRHLGEFLRHRRARRPVVAQRVRLHPGEKPARPRGQGGPRGVGIGGAIGQVVARVRVAVQAHGDEVQRARRLHAVEFHPQLRRLPERLLVIGRLGAQHVLARRKGHRVAERLQRLIAPRAVPAGAVGRDALFIVEKGDLAQAAAGVLRFERELERVGADGLAVGRALERELRRLFQGGLDVQAQPELLRDLARGPALGQHLLHDVRPVKVIVELAGGEKVRLLVFAAVHVPADEALRALRAVEESVRAPEHPAFAVFVGEKGEQLAAAVRHVVPADGAVAVSGHSEAAVRGEIHRPGGAGRGRLPALLAGGGEVAERPFRAEREAGGVAGDGEAAGPLVGLEGERLAGELRGGGVFPVGDGKTLGARRGERRCSPHS